VENALLNPITPDEPAGPNLEYDAAFMALERAMQGKPEQQIGSTIVPAQEPEWPEVRRLASDVLARSKDLRAATGLAKALLRTGGFVGFADGLTVLRGLVEEYWGSLHPQPDPDDGNDSTMRVNILSGLAEPSVLAAVRAAPLVASRAIGRFTLKDVEIASGDLPAPGGTEAATTATIEAAVMDCDLAVLEATVNAARAGFEALNAVETYVAQQIGVEQGPAFGKVSALLKKAGTFLAAGLARRQPAATGDAGAFGASDGGATPAAAGPALSGEIRSREDVLSALDKICRYYAKHEPSSPIPMFMERCQRLVSMNFVDIVKDLAPDAMNQVETLRGGAK
jgi:type VI secretion system protein ImpA